MPQPQSASVNGFSLAEILIALALLGIVAAFTIPKVLVGNQDARNSALLKEVVASMYQITTKAG